MGCGAAEATGLGVVCFVVINLRVLSANRVDSGLFNNFPIPPSPQRRVVSLEQSRVPRYLCFGYEQGEVVFAAQKVGGRGQKAVYMEL